MIKLVSLLLFVIVSFAFQAESGEFIAGRQFEKTVGKEAAFSIADSQEVFAVTAPKGHKVRLTAKQANSLRQFLLSDSTYIFDKKKRCLFIPEIIYKFKENPEVTVFVCYSFNQIKVVGPKNTVILDYDIVADEFNKIHKKIIGLLKEV